MNKICTSIEQSQKLIELGVDANTSDMYWSLVNKNHPPIIGKYCAEYGGMQLPAWSLSKLMELMPNVNGHYPELCRGKQTGLYYMWIEDTFDTQTFDNPIDAAFEMICWLKEKK